jgi:cytochrome c-type biogenesis protein CcmH/NrfG
VEFFRLVCALLVVMILVYSWGKFRKTNALRSLEKARKKLGVGSPLEAIKILQNIGEDLCLDTHYWELLGHAFLQANAPEDAKKAFLKVLSINPEHREAHLMLDRLGVLTRRR